MADRQTPCLRLHPKVGCGPDKQPPICREFCQTRSSIALWRLNICTFRELPNTYSRRERIFTWCPRCRQSRKMESHDAGSDHVGGSEILRAERSRAGDTVAAVVVISAGGLSVPMVACTSPEACITMRQSHSRVPWRHAAGVRSQAPGAFISRRLSTSLLIDPTLPRRSVEHGQHPPEI